MIPLDPRTWAVIGLGIALAGALSLAGVQTVRLAKAETALAQEQRDREAERGAAKDAAIQEAHDNAKESQRRLDRQQENQLAQDRKLAIARADAQRNAAAADQLRDQNATAARQWSAALGDSPTQRECASAGDAIGVLADVLGRVDRRAGILASHADAARAAGLKCEADYDALKPPP